MAESDFKWHNKFDWGATLDYVTKSSSGQTVDTIIVLKAIDSDDSESGLTVAMCAATSAEMTVRRTGKGGSRLWKASYKELDWNDASSQLNRI